jgi:hypothetical protein
VGIRRGMNKLIVLLVHCALFVSAASGQGRENVQLQISKSSNPKALFHWTISNHGNESVFIYDFYLWGPAFRVQQTAGGIRIQTTPVKEEPGCPPNRFPPVLLLHVAPGRSVEGDFTDEYIKVEAGRTVSMTIAAGADAYSVGELAKQFSQSNCKHSPNDAIVRWGTIINSNSIRVP